MQKKLLILGISLALWAGLVYGAWQFTELKMMYLRFFLAYAKTVKGGGSMTGFYSVFAGTFLATMVGAGIYEYLATSKNKDPVLPATLAAFIVTAVLGAIHLLVAFIADKGPATQFSVSVPELFALPGLTGVLYLVLRFNLFGVREDGDGQVRRGLTVLDKPKQALATFRRLAKREGEAGALIHPKLRLPRGRETKHILLVSSPGGGKTQVMFPLLADVLERGEAAIVYDFKGDYTAAYGEMRDALILTPFDARGAAWDIAADLDSEIKIAEFAGSLIPEGDAKEPFFRRGAQDVLTAVMIRLQHTRPGKWSFSDVVKILESRDEILKTCAEFSPATLNVLGDGKSDQAGGIFGELRTSTMQLEYLARAWDGARDKFSITRWVRDEAYRSSSRVVILQGNQQYRRLEGFLTSMIFSLVIKEVLALPDSHERRMWAFLDEFGNLPAIEGIDTMLTAVRSKGLRVVCAIQNFAQIEKAYSAAFSKTFSGCFGTVLAGHLAGETASLMSSYFGKNQMEREIAGESKSRSAKGSRRTESKGQQIVVESALLDTAFSTLKQPSLRVPASFWLGTAGWPAGKLLYPVSPTPTHYESNIKPEWLTGMAPRPKPKVVAPSEPMFKERGSEPIFKERNLDSDNDDDDEW